MPLMLLNPVAITRTEWADPADPSQGYEYVTERVPSRPVRLPGLPVLQLHRRPKSAPRHLPAWNITDPTTGFAVAFGASPAEARRELQKLVRKYGGAAGFVKVLQERQAEAMTRISKRPNPEKYRGLSIEPYEGIQVGHRPSRVTHEKRPRLIPARRKISGWKVTDPEGHSRIFNTLAEARAWVDSSGFAENPCGSRKINPGGHYYKIMAHNKALNRWEVVGEYRSRKDAIEAARGLPGLTSGSGMTYSPYSDIIVKDVGTSKGTPFLGEIVFRLYREFDGQKEKWYDATPHQGNPAPAYPPYQREEKARAARELGIAPGILMDMEYDRWNEVRRQLDEFHREAEARFRGDNKTLLGEVWAAYARKHPGRLKAIRARLSIPRKVNPGANWHDQQREMETARAEKMQRAGRPKTALALASRAAAHDFSARVSRKEIPGDEYQPMPPDLDAAPGPSWREGLTFMEQNDAQRAAQVLREKYPSLQVNVFAVELPEGRRWRVYSRQKNPGQAWHAARREGYEEAAAGDLAAGHGEAAQFWKGAAAAESAAVAQEKAAGYRANPGTFGLPYSGPKVVHRWGLGEFSVQPIDPASGSKWDWEIRATVEGRAEIEQYAGNRATAEEIGKSLIERLEGGLSKEAKDKAYWQLYRRGNPGRDLSGFSSAEILTAYNKLWRRTRERMGGAFDAPTLRVSLPQVFEEMKALDAAYRRALLQEGAPPALASEQMPRWHRKTNPTPRQGNPAPGLSPSEEREIIDRSARAERQYLDDESGNSFYFVEREADALLNKFGRARLFSIYQVAGRFDGTLASKHLGENSSVLSVVGEALERARPGFIEHEAQIAEGELRRLASRHPGPPGPPPDPTDPAEWWKQGKQPNPTPRQGFETFHGAAPDRTRRVKVPQGWPRKLWMLGALKVLILKDGKRITGGTVAAGTGNRIYILNANYTGRLGPRARAAQIEYVTPRASQRAGPVWFHPFDSPPPVREAAHGFLTLAGQSLKLTDRGIVG